MKKIFKTLILVGLFCVTLTGCGKKVNLEDYVTIEYEGANGFAKPEAVFDKAALAEALDTTEENMYFIAFSADLRVEFDKNEDLSNGDKIVGTFKWDETFAKEFDVKISGKEMKMKVEGLEDAQLIDPFADLNITYIGKSKEGKVELSFNDPFVEENFEFRVSDNGSLENGKTFMIEAIYSDGLSEEGYMVVQNEKEFVAEGMDALVEDYGLVDEETKKLIQEGALAEIEEKMAKEKNIQADTWQYVGTYFFSGGENNLGRPVVVYTTTLHSLNGAFEDTNIYTPVYFEDMYEKADGTYEIDLDRASLNSWATVKLSTGKRLEQFYGYPDEMSLYNGVDDGIGFWQSTFKVYDGLQEF